MCALEENSALGGKTRVSVITEVMFCAGAVVVVLIFRYWKVPDILGTAAEASIFNAKSDRGCVEAQPQTPTKPGFRFDSQATHEHAGFISLSSIENGGEGRGEEVFSKLLAPGAF